MGVTQIRWYKGAYKVKILEHKQDLIVKALEDIPMAKKLLIKEGSIFNTYPELLWDYQRYKREDIE